MCAEEEEGSSMEPGAGGNNDDNDDCSNSAATTNSIGGVRCGLRALESLYVLRVFKCGGICYKERSWTFTTCTQMGV